jgi:phosphoglycolate phosphatase
VKTAILFDLDGTLLDTLGDLHAATNAVLRQFGYPERTMEEVRQFVGNGARRLIEQAVPAGEEARVNEVLSAFQTYYAAHCDILTRPYPGIPELLACLDGKYPLAVVSNKPDRAVKELAKIYFPALYARGESADCPRKPAPDMVHMAMQALDAENCVYVGDSEVDVLTAKNAHVPCLSVTWGFRDEQVLRETGAEYFCHRAEDVPKCIEEILKRELENGK